MDWLNFKLYVLEVMVERIDVCDFDGGNRVTLVAENLHTPHGLVLDPTVGCVLNAMSSRILPVYGQIHIRVNFSNDSY